MFSPVGALSASWSKVMHSPPAFVIRARAMLVKRSAHTVSFGTSSRRESSVTEPTTTAVLPSSSPDMCFASVLIEIDGRFVLDMKRRFSTSALNSESVRRARKR